MEISNGLRTPVVFTPPESGAARAPRAVEAVAPVNRNESGDRRRDLSEPVVQGELLARGSETSRVLAASLANARSASNKPVPFSTVPALRTYLEVQEQGEGGPRGELVGLDLYA